LALTGLSASLVTSVSLATWGIASGVPVLGVSTVGSLIAGSHAPRDLAAGFVIAG
jgi:hypothetical protein